MTLATAAGEFCEAVTAGLRDGDLDAIDDAVLRDVLTAAVKAYAAKSEAAVAACAIIRAADLNLFDIAMWFQRPVARL